MSELNHHNAQFPSTGALSYAGNPVRRVAAPMPERLQESPFASPRNNTGTVVSHRRRPMNQHASGAIKRDHDSVLKSMANTGRVLTLTMSGGNDVTGPIVRCDRFTVTIERTGTTPGSVYHEIVYKHAIKTIKLPEFNKDEARANV